MSGEESVAKRAIAGARVVMKGNWKTADASHLIARVVSGGLTNLLNLVQFVDPATGKVIDQVLVRLFGEGTEVFIDRALDNAVSELMSITGIAPKVFGSFPEGRVEQFVDNARMITFKDMQIPVVMSQIARYLAQMHSTPLHICLKVGFRADVPMTTYMLKKMLHGAVKVNFPNCGRKALRLASLEVALLFNEVEWLANELEESGMPKMLCHRDLQSGNIMVQYQNEDRDVANEGEEGNSEEDTEGGGGVSVAACVKKGRVFLIDFEYSGLDYVAFDFGNTFNEMCINNFCTRFPGFVFDPDLYPQRAQQHAFFKEYLAHFDGPERLFPGQMHLSEEEKLEKLCDYANLGALASHLQWALWGIMQSCQSTIEFGHLEYSSARLDQYHNLKLKLGYTETN